MRRVKPERTSRWTLWLAAVLLVEGVGAQPGDAVLEASLHPRPLWVGQVFETRVAVRMARSTIERLAPISRRPLDLPMRLEAPWLEGGPGMRPFGPLSLGSGGAPCTTVVNGRAVRAGLSRPAGDTRELVLSRRFVAERPGVLGLEAPVLRFELGVRYEEDLVRGRVAVERRAVEVRGRPLAVNVAELPRPRPRGFTGLVGRIRLEAQVAPRRLAVGDVLALRLRIAGEGDLWTFPAPRPRWPGWHLRGLRELPPAPGEAVRTLHYEFVVEDPGVDAVPELVVPYFDPGPPPGYRHARTRPIPVVVRGGRLARSGAESTPTGGEATPGLRPIATRTGDARDLPRWRRRPSALFLGLAAVAPWSLLVLAWWWRRRRRGRPARRRRRRLREARRRLERAREEAAVREAFVAALAILLERRRAAVVCPRLAERLRARGASPAAAREAERVLDHLLASRHAGRPSPFGGRELIALVDRLGRELEIAEGAPS